MCEVILVVIQSALDAITARVALAAGAAAGSLTSFQLAAAPGVLLTAAVLCAACAAAQCGLRASRPERAQ